MNSSSSRCFGSLATFYWWRSQGNTCLDTQVPIDNQSASRIKFYSSKLLGVLAMNHLLETIIKCSKCLHQTYKSSSHRFWSPTNGSLLRNIQLVFGILHWWTSFLSSKQRGTSLRPKEFNNPCMLSFQMEQNNWECRTYVKNSKHRKTTTDNVCMKTPNPKP